MKLTAMSKNELIGAIAKYQVMIDSLSHQRSTRRRHTEKFASHTSNHYLPVKKNNTTNNNITNKIRDMKSTHWHSRPRINSESNRSVSSSLNVSTISNDNIDLALQMVTHQTRNESALRQQNRILREKMEEIHHRHKNLTSIPGPMFKGPDLDSIAVEESSYTHGSQNGSLPPPPPYDPHEVEDELTSRAVHDKDVPPPPY